MKSLFLLFLIIITPQLSHSTEIDNIVYKGQRYIERGQYSKATQLYEEEIKNNRNEPLLYLNAGVSSLLNRDYEQASTFFDKAIELDNNLIEKIQRIEATYGIKRAADKDPCVQNKRRHKAVGASPDFLDYLFQACKSGTKNNQVFIDLLIENKTSWVISMLDAGQDANTFEIIMIGFGYSKPTKARSALMIAAENGNLAIVKKLVKHGANINHSSAFGLTALSMARSTQSESVVSYLKSLDAEEQSSTFWSRTVNAVEDSIRETMAGGHDQNTGTASGIFCVNTTEIEVHSNGYLDYESIVIIPPKNVKVIGKTAAKIQIDGNGNGGCVGGQYLIKIPSIQALAKVHLKGARHLYSLYFDVESKTFELR